MGRLCLRHEDAIAVQRANQGYVWWLRTAGPESIVPSLARVSAAWNRKKDEEGVQDHPLRIVMLSTLLEAVSLLSFALALALLAFPGLALRRRCGVVSILELLLGCQSTGRRCRGRCRCG